MAQHISLEGIAENAWDEKINLGNKIKAFGEECVHNFPFEWKCIGMCELGDVGGTYAAALTEAVKHSNEIGFGSGFLVGLGYAYYHIKNDAREHGVKTSKADTAMAVLTAETGCVIAATGVAYWIGSTYGIDFTDPVLIKEITQNWKTYAQDLGIRIGGILPAIPIGLLAMSAFTFPKKKEAARIVADKDASLYLKRVIGKNHRTTYRKGNKEGYIPSIIRITGENSRIAIVEERLPKIYQDRFDPRNSSLYRVFTPGARYSEDAKKSAGALLCNAFNEIGLNEHKHVENPFSHDHSHKPSHKHNPSHVH